WKSKPGKFLLRGSSRQGACDTHASITHVDSGGPVIVQLCRHADCCLAANRPYLHFILTWRVVADAEEAVAAARAVAGAEIKSQPLHERFGCERHRCGELIKLVTVVCVHERKLKVDPVPQEILVEQSDLGSETRTRTDRTHSERNPRSFLGIRFLCD